MKSFLRSVKKPVAGALAFGAGLGTLSLFPSTGNNVPKKARPLTLPSFHMLPEPCMAKNLALGDMRLQYPHITCTYRIMATTDEAGNFYDVNEQYEKIPVELAIKHLEAEQDAFHSGYYHPKYDMCPAMFVDLDACYQDDEIIFKPKNTGGRAFPRTTIDQLKTVLEDMPETDATVVKLYEVPTASMPR